MGDTLSTRTLLRPVTSWEQGQRARQILKTRTRVVHEVAGRAGKVESEQEDGASSVPASTDGRSVKVVKKGGK